MNFLFLVHNDTARNAQTRPGQQIHPGAEDPGSQARINSTNTGKNYQIGSQESVTRGVDGPDRGPTRPFAPGTTVSWSSEEMQRMLLKRPDVKAQAQAIMSSRTLQEADKKVQIKELLKKLR